MAKNNENARVKKVDGAVLSENISKLPEDKKLIIYGLVEGLLLSDETAQEKAAV